MKLITFLGIGRYDETEYTWQEQAKIARFAPVASCEFSQASEAIIFTTEEANETHGQALRDSLKIPAKFVIVPKGENETELWLIFSIIARSVLPGEEVVFDVTHGLRSFPLIGLLAAAFLQAGLKVELKAIFYGAYDVRNQSVTPHRTPMFDLTPMVTLLEWATAADRFSRTGDSRHFASLLRSQQKNLALQAKGDHDALSKIGSVGSLASLLTDVSQSLGLIRPHLAMQQVAGLPEKVEQALPTLAQAEATLPFRLLLDSMLESYKALALKEPTEDVKKDLEIERALIEWYAERELWAQAVSLSREWLVSWVMFHLGLNNLTVLSDRHRIEGVVNAEAAEFLKAKEQGKIFVPVFLKSLLQLEIILGLWKALTEVRNDIDHAGMRENPGKPEDLIKQIKKHILAIQSLPI